MLLFPLVSNSVAVDAEAATKKKSAKTTFRAVQPAPKKPGSITPSSEPPPAAEQDNPTPSLVPQPASAPNKSTGKTLQLPVQQTPTSTVTVPAASPSVTASKDNNPKTDSAKTISANLVTKSAAVHNRNLMITKTFKIENILLTAGFNISQIKELVKKIETETGFNAETAPVGQRIILTEKVEDNKRKLLAIQIPTGGNNIVVFKNRSGVIEIRKESKEAMALQSQPQSKAMYKSGRIQSSLQQFGSSQKIPSSIMAKVARVLNSKVNTKQIKSGDSLDVLYEYSYNSQGKQTDLRLLYVNLSYSGGHVEGFRYSPSGKDGGEFYDAGGTSFAKSLLAAPLKGKVKITSGFGYRVHPILGRRILHSGVDFGATPGTPVFAAGDGTVEKLGRFGGYGNYIRIKHDDTWSTAYAHLSAYAKGLSQWTRISKGDLIGYVGTTGRSTGPHLHFELLQNGTPVDALKAKLPAGGRKLTGKDLYNLRREASRIRELLNKAKKQQ